MARTKGALGKRTRAALHEATHGEFEESGRATINFLLKLVTNTKQDEGVRMRAADIVLPYLRPKLSAIEQTVHTDDDTLTEEDLNIRMEALGEAHPDLKPLIDAYLSKDKKPKSTT